MLVPQQEGYPCSPHCAGYLRELEQRKVIERLRAELALWQRRPDLGCDGKCKEADCYCGYRAWAKELDAYVQQSAQSEK